jgi:hypothetical protein
MSVVILFAVVLSGASQAMEIRQWDKLASDDNAEYVADLIQGAEQALTDEGRPDLTAQVSKLFTTKLGSDKTALVQQNSI